MGSICKRSPHKNYIKLSILINRVKFNQKAAYTSFNQNVMSKKFFLSKMPSTLYNIRLNEISHTNLKLKNLEKLNIFYYAPFDINNYGEHEEFDFCISYTVLEHIPPSDLQNFLESSIKILKPSGHFCHFIDLEDHKNPKEEPFEFLKAKSWTNEDCFVRGNRLRLNDWKNIFDKIENIEFEFIEVLERDKYKLPSGVPKSLSNFSSGILVAGKKIIF